MSPASGARSGTKPGRGDRGAGTGRPAGRALVCGHVAYQDDLVTVYPSGRKTYRCPAGCGLQDAGKKRS